MSNKVTSLFKSEHGITALYVALLSGAVANFLPDPTDGLNFYLDRKLRIKFEKGELSATQYWERKSILYYGLDSLWYIILFTIAFFIKGGVKEKGLVVLGVLATGVVVGIIFNNIKEDTKFWQKYKLVEK